MTQVIVYLDDNGLPAVVNPAEWAQEAHGIHAIAVKDVPQGKPFRIMEASGLPDGPQEEWAIDPATLTDGIGGAGTEFPPLPDDDGTGDDDAGGGAMPA